VEREIGFTMFQDIYSSAVYGVSNLFFFWDVRETLWANVSYKPFTRLFLYFLYS
jgi:hypothetical protein